MLAWAKISIFRVSKEVACNAFLDWLLERFDILICQIFSIQAKKVSGVKIFIWFSERSRKASFGLNANKSVGICANWLFDKSIDDKRWFVRNKPENTSWYEK